MEVQGTKETTFFFSVSGKGLATKYPREVFLEMLIRLIREEKKGDFSQEGNIILKAEKGEGEILHILRIC